MSSLVFVVIVAVWAVYLVQHWVRRRDHLATARSVDRFSEAMRVLERRRELPAPEALVAPRSYAASPLRPSRPGRPEVVVKNGAHSAHGATAVAPSAAYRRARAAARVRGTVLLLGSLAMVALVTLSVIGALARWWAVVGVGAAAVALALVRWSVATTPAARVHRPAADRRLAARPPRPAERHLEARVERAKAATTAEHQFAAQSVAATLRSPARRDRVVTPAAPYDAPAAPYDVVEVEAALQPSRPAVPAGPVVQPTDGTWSPVPVPPPTYTLKAAARRGPLRGSVSLPADGTEMALEEEFEDLPRIDLVG